MEKAKKIQKFNTFYLGELTITQDPMWTSMFAGTEFEEQHPRYEIETKIMRLVTARLQREETANEFGTGKEDDYQQFKCVVENNPDERVRERMYEDSVEGETEEELHRQLFYHDGNLANFCLKLS